MGAIPYVPVRISVTIGLLEGVSCIVVAGNDWLTVCRQHHSPCELDRVLDYVPVLFSVELLW